MINLSRFFKIGLPVTTVATATIITASLICLYQADAEGKKDLNNQELNDFENNLKPFEEKTVSYALESKAKAETGAEEGGAGDSIEIDVGESGMVALGDKAQDGGTSVGNGEEATELGLPQGSKGEAFVQQEMPTPGDSESSTSNGEGEATTSSEEVREKGSEDDANENLSRDSNQGLPEGKSEVAKETLDGRSDDERSQYSVQSVGLSTQLGAIPETAEGVRVVQAAQGDRGVLAAEPEQAGGSTSEVIDNSGGGVTGEGIDPDSAGVEESKNLEEEIKLFEGLGFELTSNRFQLNQVLL